MVRALTPKSKTGSRGWILPGNSEAEPWDAWIDGACTGSSARPLDLQNPAGSILGLAASHVTSLPLWLNETDESRFDGIIELQLEIRGVQARGTAAVFDWTIVAREAKRTLVLVGVLTGHLPPELETGNWPGFDVSARYFPLPADGLVIWREQGHLLVAVSREDSLCHFQTLDDTAVGSRAIQDLSCMTASLQMQGIIGDLHALVFWTDELPKGAEELSRVLKLPLSHAERPAPRSPSKTWKLTPAKEKLARQHRVRRRQLTSVLMLVALLAVGILAALGLRLALTARDVGQLQSWQATHAAALDEIHDTQARWKALDPVVNTKSYPLEVLLQVSGALPHEDVHLTLFEVKGDHVLIKAEARNLQAGVQFFDAVKKNPELKQYTWELSQPRSLANDLTQLQIQGTRLP